MKLNPKLQNRIEFVFGLGLSLSLSLFSAEASLASGKPFKTADCEFTESYEDTAYKCSAELYSCIRLEDGASRICERQLIIYCDEGEMFKGTWKGGVYGKYHRFEGVMEGSVGLHPRAVTGPVLDIEYDSSRGYPSRLQVYGKSLGGYCSVYTPGATPPPGMNP